MIKNGEVLTKDTYGDKVIRLSDGRIAKLFRLKRILSSALIWPYAKRFVRAVQILQKKNIPTVHILNTYKLPSIKRHLIVYQPLEGQSLRDLMSDENNRKKYVLEFASFFAYLHNSGIYFRAIHLNNVIVTPKGEFGLIDVADFYYSCFSLNRFKRIRNFKPILSYKEDRQAIASVSMELFLDRYLEKAQFGSPGKNLNFRKKVLLMLNGLQDRTV